MPEETAGHEKHPRASAPGILLFGTETPWITRPSPIQTLLSALASHQISLAARGLDPMKPVDHTAGQELNDLNDRSHLALKDVAMRIFGCMLLTTQYHTLLGCLAQRCHCSANIIACKQAGASCQD